MTVEEINLAIAKACPSVFYINWFSDGKHQITWAHNSNACGPVETISPYYDLNAMRDALLSQTPEFRTEFRKNLRYLVAPFTRPSNKVSGICLMGHESYDQWFHAAASEQAVVFVETLKSLSKKRK